MGRIWDFLNQDAGTGMDRLTAPYARFALSHRLFMWVGYAVVIALVWIFISRTLALLQIALLVMILLYGIVTVLWRRRRS